MIRYANSPTSLSVALVVDENWARRREISEYLRSKGFGVLEAQTSVEALLLSVEYPDPIRALFTSLDLARYCNGTELADCLRSMRPGIAVFYLGDEEQQSEEIVQELISGKGIFLRNPVTAPRMDDAIALVEESSRALDSLPDASDWG